MGGMMDKYWAVYKEDLEMVSNFEYLTAVAVSVLYDMKKKENREIVQICGPISTGGLKSKQANIHRFKRAIEVSQEKGLFTFDQFHLFEAIDRICQTGYKEVTGYYTDILEILYSGIFRSGYISKALFLPGWQDSVGATWERRALKYLGIPVEEYPPEWLALL
jgi:hypothetical protein